MTGQLTHWTLTELKKAKEEKGKNGATSWAKFDQKSHHLEQTRLDGFEKGLPPTTDGHRQRERFIGRQDLKYISNRFYCSFRKLFDCAFKETLRWGKMYGQ